MKKEKVNQACLLIMLNIPLLSCDTSRFIILFPMEPCGGYVYLSINLVLHNKYYLTANR